MSRALAILWKPREAVGVIVAAGAQPVVESVTRVAFPLEDSPRRRGERFRAAMAETHPARLPAVVVLPRESVTAQSFQLPPAPDEEVASLALMQAERELAIGDDGLGFDFLPLEGDAEHPRRVLGVAVTPKAWRELTEFCEAAQVKLRQVVPEPFGWPRLAALALVAEPTAAGGKGTAAGENSGPHVGVAVEPGWGAIWAAADGAVRLVRSVRLPAVNADDLAACSTVLVGELRRTILSFSQQHPGGGDASIWLAGSGRVAELGGQLAAALGRDVRVGQLRSMFDAAAVTESPSGEEWGAAASLAAGLAAGERPLVDLANPRRPPEPATRRTTYVLAGVAAAALVGMVAWTGHRNLQAPLEAAELAELERTALEETIADFAPDEKRAAEIGRWREGSADVMALLDKVSQAARPEPPSAPGFDAAKDAVVTRVNAVGPRVVIDATLKDMAAVGPLEDRLRTAGFRVDRGAVATGATAAPEYGISLSESLVHDATQAEAAATTGAKP